jgi:hypothetical protein
MNSYGYNDMAEMIKINQIILLQFLSIFFQMHQYERNPFSVNILSKIQINHHIGPSKSFTIKRIKEASGGKSCHRL